MELHQDHAPPPGGTTPTASDHQEPTALNKLLGLCIQRKASDIYLTCGSPPCLRIGDKLEKVGVEPLSDWDVQNVLEKLLTPDQINNFHMMLEMNAAIAWGDKARFRINAYRQKQHNAIVIRRIETEIPSLESLSLPAPYKDLIMAKRGLALLVGQTGCGKSTSLAAMIGHRNTHDTGHIITIEDPVEFAHKHEGCIISQRDIGIDTLSLQAALKNALRQRPDVILIGEIRDRDTMEYALNFAETGHLCVATLHANNASQAIERIVNFFPEEKQKQVLLSLSNNLKGCLSQRLVANLRGGRTLVTEIMLNVGLITSLIQEGRIKEIRSFMEKNRGQGMQTFDQGLVELFMAGTISEAVAISEADNASNVRLAITQKEGSMKIQGVWEQEPTKNQSIF